MNVCVAGEQRGFICGRKATKAQDICLGAKQSVCHFEMRSDEAVLVYTGKGRVYMAAFHGFILEDDIAVGTSSHSNICGFFFNVIVIMGCDFD